MTPEDEDERRRRAARRAYIRANHPDVGGDPDAFAAGLTRFGGPPGPAASAASSAPRLRVRRSRRPDRVVLRFVRRTLGARSGRPRRNLK